MTYIEDRARSIGLSKNDIKTLHLTQKTSTWALQSGFEERPLVHIPYFEPDGTEAPLFYRVRYSDLKGSKGLASAAPRYSQPGGQLPRFYLPPIARWQAVCPDPSQPLVITEGEFKSMALCKLGYATIGVGGVWNWKSKKAALTSIPDFDFFEWGGREVYLAFDSDVMTKPDVKRALVSLAHHLTSRTARVFICDVPPDKDHAQGVDDYAFAKGRKRAKERVAKLIRAATPFQPFNAIEDLNLTHTYISELRMVYSEREGLLSHQLFKDTAPPPRTMVRISDATGRMVEVSRAAEWLGHPQRATVSRLAFDPALPYGRDEEHDVYNEFRGWPEPRRGSVQPFLDLVHHLFGGRRSEIAWLLSWCAYPFQSPGERALQAVILYSATNGSGKGQFVRCLSKSHDPYYASLAFTDIEQRFFGSNLVRRTLISLDEGEDRHENNRPATGVLKQLITDATPHVEEKYKAHYKLDNRAHFVMTTNYPNSMHLAQQDRRFFVPEVTERVLPVALRERINKWATDPLCGSYLHYYLKHTVKLSKDFDPLGYAPITSAKEMLIEVTGSALDDFARSVVQYGVWQGWRVPEVTTARAMRAVYDPEGTTKVSVNGMALALLRAGAQRVGPGIRRVVMLKSGMSSPIALRNAEIHKGKKPAYYQTLLETTHPVREQGK